MRWHHLSCSLVLGVTEHSTAHLNSIKLLREDNNVLLDPPVLLIQVRWQG